MDRIPPIFSKEASLKVQHSDWKSLKCIKILFILLLTTDGSLAPFAASLIFSSHQQQFPSMFLSLQ